MNPAAFVSRVALAAVLCASGPVRAGSLLETMDQEVSTHFQNAREAVVKVHAKPVAGTAAHTAGAHRVGTGFFIDAEGRLLTSATVVALSTNCWVDWRGQRLAAKLLGRDPLTNLALLQIDQRTPFLARGNSDELRVGSMAIAIGFPYDQPSEPTVGWVRGFDIKCGPRSFPTTHFRASCRLRPGQGGGPVLNARGQVVGIALAAHADDQCYVLPINAASKVMGDIRAHGAPRHGWIGLSVTERQAAVVSTNAANWEVYIDQVFANTPAAVAGFQSDDLLLQIHTNPIARAAHALDVIFQRTPGESLSFTVLRQGSTQRVDLVVGQRPPEPSAPAVPPQLPLNLLPVCSKPPAN